MKYKVSLENFEGPLDLLLHLIKDNEIEIYDIPIALITKQYLEYLDLIKTLNLEIVGDFLVMAAELTRIKSKMLLPKPVFDDGTDDTEDDPRETLILRLIEYKKFKEAAEELKRKELYKQDLFTRTTEIIQKPSKTDEEDFISDISVFELMKAFQKVMKEISIRASYKITFDEVSVDDKMEYICQSLEISSQITLDALFVKEMTKMELVAVFLALLELIRQKVIRVYQVKQFGTLRIVKGTLLSKPEQ